MKKSIYLLIFVSLQLFSEKGNSLDSRRVKKVHQSKISALVVSEDYEALKSILGQDVNTGRSCTTKEVAKKRTCEAIKKFPKKEHELSFFTGKSEVCEPYWQALASSYGITDYKSLDVCNDPKYDSYSDEFVLKSRKDMEKLGYTHFEYDDLEFLEHLDRVQKKVESHIDTCCSIGLTLDDYEKYEKCREGFSNLKVRFCNSKNADLSHPDTCTEGAFYNLRDLEYLALHEKYKGHLIETLTEMGHDIKSYSKLSLLEKKEITDRLGLGSFEALYLEKVPENQFIFPGSITLNMYGKKWESGYVSWEDNEDVVNHEMIHACNEVRTQIHMKNDPKVVDLYFGNWDNFCELEAVDDVAKIQKLVARDYGVNGEFIDCLSSVALASTREIPLQKCENACPATYLEEGLTELMNMFRSGFRYSFPGNACYSYRDNFHPMNTDVLECALQTIPGFPEYFSEELRCSDI